MKLLSPSSEAFGKTISQLWLFAILNTIFRDLHEMTLASTLAEISTGYVNGNRITDEVLLFGAFAVELLLLAFLLSSLLAPSAVRRINLILAPLAIVGVLFGSPKDLDDYFFATVSIATFLTIFVTCLTWKPAKTANPALGGQHVA